MSAFTFLAGASRFKCRPFLSGIELAPGALAVGQGEACLSCASGCNAPAGESLAQGGIVAYPGENAVELRWTCPTCGITVTEHCRTLNVMRQSADIHNDPFCHRCRTPVSSTHP